MRIGGCAKLAAVLGIGFGAAAASDAEAQYFAGETITVVIGLSAGGTVDTAIRSLAPYWAKHIPGEPTIVVQNLTGAGGIRATNHVYSAEPDGLTLFYGPWSAISQVLGDEALEADYSDFEFLGGLSNTRISFARTDIVPGGLKSPTDIVNVESPFVLGGIEPTFQPDIMARFSFDLLGVDYVYAPGFSGGSEIRAAIQRGEVQAANSAYTTVTRSLGDALAAGEILPLFYLVPVEEDGSFEAHPGIPDIPPFPEVYLEIHGELPSGPTWDAFNWFVSVNEQIGHIAVAPPGTPQEAVDDLRTGFAAAFEDPEYTEFRARTDPGGINQPVGVEVGERVLARVGQVTPEIVQTLIDFIEAGQQ